MQLLVDLLTAPLYGSERYLGLPVFDLQEDKRAAIVPLSRLKVILGPVISEPDERAQIARIPSTFFVWSEDLETAYQRFHLHFCSPDEFPADYGVHLAASNAPHDDLIRECAKFTRLLVRKSSKHEKRKRATNKRDREIYTQITNLRRQKKMKVTDACRKLRREPTFRGMSVGRIHRVYYNQKKLCEEV